MSIEHPEGALSSIGSGRGRNSAALAAFATGALGSVVAAAALRARPPGGVARWTRTSHAGRPVTLFEGPAYAVGAVAGALAGGGGGPAVVAGVGAAAFGALDDLAGDGARKGLRGHLAAAVRGEVTTGALKIVGLIGTGTMAALIIDRSPKRHCAHPSHRALAGGRSRGGGGVMGTLVGGGVIAGSANLANLLDLRPGRALKVVLLMAVPLLAGGPPASMASAIAGAVAGAAVGSLPDDLAGRSMLGDTGANSAGALLGTALVARTGLRGRLPALGILTALTLASERVSFTRVIESTPGLRELDALGRARSPRTPGVTAVGPRVAGQIPDDVASRASAGQ